METEVFSALERVLSLGWPALVTVAFVYLWRYHVVYQKEMFDQYKAIQAEYTATLRELAGLRSTTSMLPATPRVPMSAIHGDAGD